MLLIIIVLICVSESQMCPHYEINGNVTDDVINSLEESSFQYAIFIEISIGNKDYEELYNIAKHRCERDAINIVIDLESGKIGYYHNLMIHNPVHVVKSIMKKDGSYILDRLPRLIDNLDKFIVNKQSSNVYVFSPVTNAVVSCLCLIWFVYVCYGLYIHAQRCNIPRTYHYSSDSTSTTSSDSSSD